jgi:predicted RNA-binding Zn-ribbon protein involved in translation (DUF1610 family)
MSGAVRATLVKLTCPKCGEVQARVRPKPGQTLQCRRCRADLPAPPVRPR